MVLKDATERLDRLRTVLNHVTRDAPGCDVELFVRESTRTRVTRIEGAGDDVTRHDVHERGTAVRVAGRDGGRGWIGFAATTGGDDAAIRWSFEQARADRAEPDDDPWFADGAEDVRHDLDPGTWSPPAEGDLRAAEKQLAGFAPDGVGLTVAAAWIETGRTDEWLVSSRGVRAVRRRVRTWVLFECGVDVVGARFRRPLIVAVRGARTPDLSAVEDTVRAWRHAVVDVALPAGPVGFGPAAAGLLVRSLGGGPGVTDRPADPAALFGGTHDDCGFPTGDRVGRWRGSFRDPPTARPAHLVVERDPASVVPGVRIEDLRIHRVEPGSWVLEGIAVPRGRVRFRVDPGDLGGRIVGTIGDSRVSHHGVTTPGLVLDRP